MQVIEAARDFDSLQRYLPAFIETAATMAESALAARRRELRQAAAVNPSRERERAVKQGTIPHAFELWILHLGELDALSTAAGLTLDDLTAEEARGLAMLRRARQRFWEAHTCCPRCGSVNPRYATFCGGCGEQQASDFRPQT